MGTPHISTFTRWQCVVAVDVAVAVAAVQGEQQKHATINNAVAKWRQQLQRDGGGDEESRAVWQQC